MTAVSTGHKSETSHDQAVSDFQQGINRELIRRQVNEHVQEYLAEHGTREERIQEYLAEHGTAALSEKMARTQTNQFWSRMRFRTTSFWAQTTSVEARLQRSLSAIPDQQAGCSRSADNRAWITKTASTMLIGPRVRGARTWTAHARITAGYTTH